MSSAKADIKSKKDKLAEKQQRKQKLTVKPIEISSSEEPPLPLPTQKRRTSSKQTTVEPPTKFNVFNIDRLKKVELEPARDQPKELAVEEITIENPMKHTDARALFTYRIEGNESTKYVSDLYLQQRIKKMAEEQEARTAADAKDKQEPEEKQPEDAEPVEDKQEGKQEGKEEPNEEKEKERSRPVRYFQSLVKEGEEERDLVKCFRCNKRGHIAKNCLEEREQAKCIYCLGDHHHHDCNARACFKCNELGHIAQECRSIAIECRRCHKKGHAEKQCGIIVFLDYSRIRSDQEFRDKFSGDDLRRVRCMAGCEDPNGHFNCHQYQLLGTKHAPYATYAHSHNEDSLPAFKAMARYQYSDLDPKYEREHERSYEKKHSGRRDERYQRSERPQRQYDRGQQRKGSGSKSKQKPHTPVSYDNYNDKYNISSMSNVRYDYNANQRINQRYNYNGYQGGRW